MTDEELCREALILSGAHPERCMRCGKCSGACPSYDEMEYHPHQFAHMLLKGQIRELMESESLYKCLSCFVCVERCPRQVMPANIGEAVRVLAMRGRGGDRLHAEDIPKLVPSDAPQQLFMAAMRKYSK